MERNVAVKRAFDMVSLLASEGVAEYDSLRVTGIRATHIAGLRLNPCVHFATHVGNMLASVRLKNGQVGHGNYFIACLLIQLSMTAAKPSFALTSTSPLSKLYEDCLMGFKVFMEAFIDATSKIDVASQAFDVRECEVARLCKRQEIDTMQPL